MRKLRFKHSRSIHFFKSLSWRVIASLTTALVAWAVTGEFLIGVAVGGIEAVLKIFLYYGHERAWYNWAEVRQPELQPVREEINE